MDGDLLRWIGTVFGESHDNYEKLASAIAESPDRIGRAYRDLLGGCAVDLVSLLKPVAEISPDDPPGRVVVTDIPFISMCAHHFLPFFGVATAAYEPEYVIVGIGKIPRLVDALARRFQLQELLTRQIAVELHARARARGAWAEISARHLCMCYRGPTAIGATTVTSYGCGSMSGGR